MSGPCREPRSDYSPSVLRGRIAASVLAAMATAVMAVPAHATSGGSQAVAASRAVADEGGGTGGSKIGDPPFTGPIDPCTESTCQQAPEAPAALLYPAAGFASVLAFVALERRRRSRRRRAASFLAGDRG